MSVNFMVVTLLDYVGALQYYTYIWHSVIQVLTVYVSLSVIVAVSTSLHVTHNVHNKVTEICSVS